METKIPPPITALLFLAAMWAVDRLFMVGQFDMPGRAFLSLMGVILGVSVAVCANIAFSKAGTTINPLDPSKASNLVSHGVFRYTRNPMYLGLFTILIGACIWFGNLLNIGLLIAFIWYMTTFQIKPEEEALTEIFGGAYTDYCKRVRRWI